MRGGGRKCTFTRYFIETYFVAYYAYFTAKLHQFKKTLGQFEKLVFVIMQTRENIRLIARSSFQYIHVASSVL